MKTTWVLVADEAIARILEKPRKPGDLVPVEELTDADAHAREREFSHGPHGRRAGVAGPGSQATVSAADAESHQHAQAFAKRVVERLEQHHRDRRYDELHVIAAPRQLGYLRKALEPHLAGVVVNTLDKDLVKASNSDLTQRLFAA
jgi:protein required for attachment to host cells